MKHVYTTAFKINGINLPAGMKELVLTEIDKTKVLLCSEISTYASNSDKNNAANMIMLNRLTGATEQTNIQTILESNIKLIEAQRNKKYPTGPFIIFESMWDSDINISQETTHNLGSTTLLLKKINIDVVKKKHDQLINNHLTALFLVALDDFTINKIFEHIYLTENNTIYYPGLSSFGGSATFSNALTTESTEKLKEYIFKLGDNNQYNRITRLLFRASSNKSDNMKSFIFAWTALDIFLNKLFKIYKPKFFFKYTENEAPEVVKNIFEKTNDQYSLMEKFIIIISIVHVDIEIDVNKFKRIKKLRNDFIHGNKDIKETDLPTDELINLVRKYLTLHLLEPDP